jgi:hypothetical protein
MGNRIFRIMFVMLFIVIVPAYGDTEKKEPSVIYLDQGWSPESRRQFYHTPQGTKLIRHDWFMNLELPSGELFKDDIATRYGFIPDPAYPAGLPVGFTKNPDDEYLGLNCAACHTSQIRYRGKTVYIDGGASMQNNLAFMKSMLASLGATLQDEDKFTRFAHKVGGERTQLNKDVLEFLKLQDEPLRKAREECHDPEKKDRYTARDFSIYPKDGWGFGRLDALGRGGNALLTNYDACALEKADAPVSIPSLWETWKYDWVQWNGSIQNPLARNLGQAIGLNGMSADVRTLHQLETYVQELKPPRWREFFGLFGEEGQIDEKKAQRGKELYYQGSDHYASNGKGLCAHCHVPPRERTCDDKEEKDWIMTMVPLNEIGTDEGTAMNFEKRALKIGRMNEQETISAATIMQNKTSEIMNDQFVKLPISLHDQQKMQRCRPNGWRAPLEYKAPTHAGVWATPPYLHNGSVPNLYQLLLPAEKRMTKFCVGSLEFDPVNVGFRTDLCALEEVPFDTKLSGNSNKGHEFKGDCKTFIKKGKDGILGCELKEEDRWAIIEYLKTL